MLFSDVSVLRPLPTNVQQQIEIRECYHPVNDIQAWSLLTYPLYVVHFAQLNGLLREKKDMHYALGTVKRQF